MKRCPHGARIARAAFAPFAAAAMLVAALLMLGAPPAALAAAAAPPITVPFDHRSTGFLLDGVHRDLPCESCHLDALFMGTPRSCGVCHITGSRYNATPKTANHILTTNHCAACHDTTSFRPAIHFDHAQVLGTCAGCHNGVIAQGEGRTHPSTGQACEACHTVMSWNPPKAVDHTQIPLAVAGFCVICHNGVQASGKNATHLQTNLECGDCHLSSTWLGAGFDHSGVVSGCFTCHNGTVAVGKQGAHMPTSNVCETCHTTGLGTKTPSWAPSLFLHTQMSVNTCQTCHNGTVKISTGFVSGQPANHVPPIPAGVDCGVCHGNNPAAETWAVVAASIATLHAGLAANDCVMCHAGQTFAGVPAPYVPMAISGLSPIRSTPLAPPHIPVLPGTDCSACHGAVYQAGGFGPATAMSAAKHAFVSTTCDTCHDTGKSFYVGGGTALQLRPANHITASDPRLATGDCSGCHETRDWNSTALPAGHMPNPANQACSVCHTAAPNDYTTATLAANAALHTGIAGGCGQCHGGTTALTWYNNFTPKDALLAPAHIPYLAGSDCSSCHSSSTYAVGTFGPMNMTQAKHAFVPTTCDTCHETANSFYMGAASPGLQGRPANHSTGLMVAPNDCSLCHNTANWNSTALPAGHMPNPGNQGCATCHTAAPSDYTVLASIAVLHTGITNGCSQCHGGTTQLTFYNNIDNPKAAVLTPAHIPALTGSDCSSCHAPNFVAGGFGPMNMTQATHAGVGTTCDTCHEAGLSFYMGAASPGLQGRPANHSTGQMVAPNDCSICHTTANWNSTAMPAGHMPNPANNACTVCHTTAPADYSTTTLAATTVLHTGISSGCLTCHGAPNSSPPVFYNNYTPKDAVLAPVHIPTSATPCEDCHSPAVFTSFSGTTMTSAKHTAMFAVIGTTCDACHESTTPPLSFYGVTNLTVRPNGHHVGEDCSRCHNTNDWGGDSATRATAATKSKVMLVVSPAARGTAIGAGGAVAPGAAGSRTGGPRVGTSPIGNPGAGTPARALVMSVPGPTHAGVIGNCATCHNGVLATGKAPTHIASNNSCDDCHTTIAWLPARFDHRYITQSCVSCHNGIVAPGKPALHVQTLRDCGACHGTFAWQPASFSHTGVIGACQTCHNGVTAAGKQAQHPATVQDCASCHNTLVWTMTRSPAPLRPLLMIRRGVSGGPVK
ncbi:MAG TPA: cytochrome c3 family protein [Steroidobacteraceae bacterium]|nr:cytochrome c3 family protein [Steroidobacteraceae bacterium]